MSESSREDVMRKGAVLIDQGRYNDAIKVFKDGLSFDPTNDVLLYYLALAQYHVKDLRKQSLQTIEEALNHETQEPAYYRLKSLILASLDKPKLALESIEESLRLNPEYAEAHAAKAYVYSILKKWQDAEKCAKDALAFDADNQFAGNVLAHALRMQNKLDESAHLVSDLLAKDPDDSLSHSSTGWVYLHRKDYARAQIHFREALRLDPNFESARSGMLEAFKAKSPLYRCYLQYVFFMTRQTQSVRVAIIVGIYLACRTAMRGLREIAQGPYAIAGYAGIIILYTLLFWSWLAGGIGNLLVFSDRFARHSLNKQERLEAIFVGGGFLGGVAMIILGIVFNMLFVVVFGGSMAFSTIPFSMTFTNDHKIGKFFYGGIGAYILLVGLVFSFAILINGFSLPFVLIVAAGGMLVFFVASSWLGSFGFLRK